MEFLQIQNNSTAPEDKEIIYPILNNAGIRDYVSNYYYDLSVFKTKICKNLTGITLRYTDEYIHSIEFFYDTKSTGEFKGNCANTKQNDLILYTKHIEIKINDFLSYVKGSYNVDYITGLEFFLNSGISYRFCNNFIKDKSDIKYFKFENSEGSQIFSFKMAFGKFLTYIAPIYKDISDDMILIKNQENNLYFTPPIGRYNKDIKEFYSSENFEGGLKRICIYHDNTIVKGLELHYETGLNYIFHNYSNLENLKKIKKENLDLDLNKSEHVNEIMIRSGDLIDNITIYTNRGKVISAGGHGGFPYIYNMDKLEQVYGRKMQLTGVSGGFTESSNLQYIKFIFK